MKRIVEFSQGLAILAKYSKDGYEMGAQHDIVLVNVHNVSEEDIATLKKLGWFVSEEYECWAKFT